MLDAFKTNFYYLFIFRMSSSELRCLLFVTSSFIKAVYQKQKQEENKTRNRLTEDACTEEMGYSVGRGPWEFPGKHKTTNVGHWKSSGYCHSPLKRKTTVNP